MIGIIISGHGRFASGIASSIELLAGPQEYFTAIDFEEDVDALHTSFQEAFEARKDLTGTIVFTDLAGGSPFKTAVLAAQEYANVNIIAGTNLPMLAEVIMARKFIDDLETLTSTAIATGKDQIVQFDFVSLSADEEEEDFEDGI